MALLERCSRLQGNPRWIWKTTRRSFRVGEPCKLPETPYWRGGGKKIIVKSFDEMPGPKPLFLLGNMWRYWSFVGQNSFLKLHETYNSYFKKYGYIVKEVMYPGHTIVHLYHPEDIMSVYHGPGKYPLRQSHTAMERYRRERPHIYSSAGLGASNGEEWLKFRKLFINMLNESTIQSYPVVTNEYYNKMEEVANDFVQKVGCSLDANGEIDIRTPLFRWALESTGVITLNKRLGCLQPEGDEEADKLIKAAHATHDAIYQIETRLSPLLSMRQYKRLVKEQDYFVDIIQRHIFDSIEESQGEVNSVLALLLTSKNATTRDVCTLILDLFQGGIHSVSYSVCFALLHLAKNKDKQDKLRQMLIEKLPTKKSSMRKLKVKIPYIDHIIKETLRLNPPSIGTGRLLNSDMVLGGYQVPAGTMVIIQNQVASLDREFFRDPLVFQPERWQNDVVSDLGISDRVGKFAYQPFGFGQRACIGMMFAKMEMKFAIAKIVRNFEVSYHHEPIGTVNKLHNEPDRPVLLRLKKIDN